MYYGCFFLKKKLTTPNFYKKPKKTLFLKEILSKWYLYFLNSTFFCYLPYSKIPVAFRKGLLGILPLFWKTFRVSGVYFRVLS